MNITFDCADGINGLMTITVEKADYEERVEKTLKDYRKRINMPGFRPGMVPMGLVKKQYGMAAKVDEINKVLGEKLYDYIKENKIEMLGEPLPNEEKQVEQDMTQDGPFTFVFDIAVAPEFKIELSEKDKVDYYDIKVSDEMVGQQVDNFASQRGHYEGASEYDEKERDMLKGDLRELDENGEVKEGGITVEGAMMMPQYIKVDDQKKLFDGAKLGSLIRFNPKKAYPESDYEVSSLLKIDKEKAADVTSDFNYLVTEISRYKAHPIDQELFDSVFGEGAVKSEQEFRQRIADGIKHQLTADSDYKFMQDLRKHCEEKVGELKFPEALLKRVMLNHNREREDAEKFVDDNFAESIKQLEWHLIREQLAQQFGIKVGDDDVMQVAKEAARAQFAQYGMANVPDEYLENYAKDMLKKKEMVDNLVDRAVDLKLTAAAKECVKLNKKEVSFEEFGKMVNETAK